MKKLITIIILMIITTFTSFGQVDKDYSTTLNKMFVVAGTEETYEIVITQMFNMLKQQYPNIDETIWNDIEKEFLKSSMNDLVEMLAPVYAKYLNQDELQQIIEFYDSPVGRKLAESTPLITQESMQIGQEWGKKIGEEFVEKMEKKGY